MSQKARLHMRPPPSPPDPLPTAASRLGEGGILLRGVPHTPRSGSLRGLPRNLPRQKRFCRVACFVRCLRSQKDAIPPPFCVRGNEGMAQCGLGLLRQPIEAGSTVAAPHLYPEIGVSVGVWLTQDEAGMHPQRFA
ncbi:hypothetical protein ANRL4_01431 [Anaerolineae bacterium]|nr:hypothetical protein ANRL4_01431 [Anaerolineae bacterium]